MKGRITLAAILAASAGGCATEATWQRNDMQPAGTAIVAGDHALHTDAAWADTQTRVPIPNEAMKLMGYTGTLDLRLPQRGGGEAIPYFPGRGGRIINADELGLFTDIMPIDPGSDPDLERTTQQLHRFFPGGIDAENHWYGLRTTAPEKSTMVADNSVHELNVITQQPWIIQYELDYTRSMQPASGLRTFTQHTPELHVRLLDPANVSEEQRSTIPRFIVKYHDAEMEVQSFVLTPAHGLAGWGASGSPLFGGVVAGSESIHNALEWQRRKDAAEDKTSYGVQFFDDVSITPVHGMDDVDSLKLAQRMPLMYAAFVQDEGKHIATIALSASAYRGQNPGRNMRAVANPFTYKGDCGLTVPGYDVTFIEKQDGQPDHRVLEGFLGPIGTGLVARCMANNVETKERAVERETESGGGQNGGGGATPVPPAPSYNGGQVHGAGAAPAP